MGTINLKYFIGLNGTVFFDEDSASYTYIHENDGDFTGEYMQQVLNVLRGYAVVKLKEYHDFNSLHIRIKELLYTMEDSEKEDYE